MTIKRIQVYTVNAFTYQDKGGNPAGVVPDADGLTTRQMQNIARQMGYPETAFVCPPEQASAADLKVRFFTPTAEVDFCGHATLATFSLLWQQQILTAGDYIQDTGAGLLQVSMSETGQVSMDQQRPEFLQTFDPAVIAPLLNLPATELSTGLPIQAVSTGLADILLPLPVNTLNRLTPDQTALSQFCQQHNLIGLHAFEIQPAGAAFTAECRNFAPLFGIPEEAATGSSNGALACYLQAHHSPQQTEYNFLQGCALAQNSQINSTLQIHQGRINRVQVSGTAQLTSQQYLSVTA
ncbi:PhzF family phenazine biosynthesis protein [Aliamphritea hakodatensis]|uniref:PhzF family phenazine biosynthesis protein n=1 Tax=Aliamphritea hakodatensis TaxID=2895352 RepID=UPI0022FD9563|nr:PhzF family phenazine biosynthesis protein [Aliamphritea hakodatensis]